MQELIEQFIREKQFLKNVAKKTISFYYQSLKALTQTVGSIELSQLSKTFRSYAVA
jgi:site-specific recombinase XerD